MWYKYLEETNEWYYGNEIHLPSGTVLKDDHSIQEDGWFWSDKNLIINNNNNNYGE